MYEWAAGLQLQRDEWTRTQLVALQDTAEYGPMSEVEAVAFHLRRVDAAAEAEAAVVAAEARAAAVRAERKRSAAAALSEPAAVPISDGPSREARLCARRVRRCQAMGYEMEAEDLLPPVASGTAVEGASGVADEAANVVVPEPEAAVVVTATAVVVTASSAAQVAQVAATACLGPTPMAVSDEALLRQYNALLAAPGVNAKKALASARGIPERSLMLRIARARAALAEGQPGCQRLSSMWQQARAR